MTPFRRVLGAALPLLLASASCGGRDVIGDGGPCGQWYVKLTKVETCPGADSSDTYLSVMHVEPVAGDETQVRFMFGNQEWVVDVMPDGTFGSISRGAVTKTFSGQISGDSFIGRLEFADGIDGCTNAYELHGVKLLDYPGDIK